MAFSRLNKLFADKSNVIQDVKRKMTNKSINQ